MRRTLCGILFVAGAALAGCESGEPISAPLAVDAAGSALTTVDGVAEVVGDAGPGATYALLKPVNWNGGLVVWAHGYVQPFVPVDLPAAGSEHLGEIRDHALAAGFGFAYSSYSHTGYAVKDGAIRTHQLRGLFADAFGEPARTYLVGVSMGGLVTELLSERYPAEYDGTLAACPVLDGPYSATYVAHFRVLFDWFFQDAAGASPLPGSLYAMPEGYYLIPPGAQLPAGSDAFQAVYGAVASSPEAVQTAAVMASVKQLDLKYESVDELVMGFLHVLGYQINGANALSDLLNGRGFFDNAGTVYTSPLLDASTEGVLNHPDFGVERYTADPPGSNYMEQWWRPAGDLSRPFLTLHTTRDPLVPFRTEAMFRDVVEEAGAADLLVQRAVEAYGHCTYSDADLLRAFDDLVLWVEQGIRPTP